MAFADPDLALREFNLHAGETVADFGAGAGTYSFLAAKQVGPTGQIYAVDIQKDVLDRVIREGVQAGLHNIQPIWGNIELPQGVKLADNSVDKVIVANVLFQAEDKNALAGEVKRILHPGGRVLLIDWQASFAGLGPMEAQVVPQAAAETIFLGAGFTKIKNFSVGDYHYGLIFAKDIH